MPSSTSLIDAADSADGVARRLAGFVCDAVRYAESTSEGLARRLLTAPYSGVGRADARAILVAAGERSTAAEAIAAERIPLTHDALLATRRFVKALGELSAAYRAQGATAREVVATANLAFALGADANARERSTLEELELRAGELDADCGTRGVAWTATAFEERVERWLEREPPASEPPPLLERLGPHRSEPGRNVKRRRGHFSASSLGAFASCERKWFYRYVCAAIEDKSSSASTYGTAFHWALERFHQDYRRADQAPREQLARALDAWIVTAYERYRSGFETTIEFELQTRRARRTARRYLQWFVERSQAHPFSVIGTEATVELTLEGYEFMGYIDRIDRDDATGGVTVVDYKTGSIAESAAEYRADIANFTDFQLPFYYWARTAQGDRVTRLALVPLKDALLDVRPVELEVVPIAAPRGDRYAASGTIGIDELERARARMVEIARELSDAPLEHFPVTLDPNECTWCAYKNACRERPLRNDDRFGR